MKVDDEFDMASAAAGLRAQYLPAMRRAGVKGLLDLMRGDSDYRVSSAVLLSEHLDLVREERPGESRHIAAEIALIAGPVLLTRLAARAAH